MSKKFVWKPEEVSHLEYLDGHETTVQNGSQGNKLGERGLN
jgi:hypothetical protein